MDWYAVVMMALLSGMVAASVAGPHRLARWRRRGVARAAVLLARTRTTLTAPAPRPAGRPIEEIARDALRLGHRFRTVPHGVSYARFEGRRLAYDSVLVEACVALGVEHLLEVVPPGTELDAERVRVERVLGRAGLPLEDAA